MTIKLYTTHCPKCVILEKKLKSKHIKYEEITDREIMDDMNMLSVPQMQIDDGKPMTFAEANKYINEEL